VHPEDRNLDNETFVLAGDVGRSSRNLVELPTVARQCDRYGISNVAGAAIATATLIDYGIIDAQRSDLVIDRAKFIRQREKLRSILSEKARTSFKIYSPQSLFFDSRKDMTLCDISSNTSGTTVEEHYVLLEEPLSNFLGHVSPVSGSASEIFAAIVDYFYENNISMEDLQATEADGTNVNTGVNNGVIRLLELHLQKPFQ
jgi:hypothetical protein